MSVKKFSIGERIKSFGFAFSGLLVFFRTQHNAIIHAVATVAVLLLAVFLHLPAGKWLLIVVAIGLVWMAELFNTAIEKLCDLVCPQHDPRVKFIKDVSAAAVLISALLAVGIACIIFIPEFI